MLILFLLPNTIFVRFQSGFINNRAIFTCHDIGDICSCQVFSGQLNELVVHIDGEDESFTVKGACEQQHIIVGAGIGHLAFAQGGVLVIDLDKLLIFLVKLGMLRPVDGHIVEEVDGFLVAHFLRAVDEQTAVEHRGGYEGSHRAALVAEKHHRRFLVGLVVVGGEAQFHFAIGNSGVFGRIGFEQLLGALALESGYDGILEVPRIVHVEAAFDKVFLVVTLGEHHYVAWGGSLAQLGDGVFPEVGGYSVGHIAAETVNAHFSDPELHGVDHGSAHLLVVVVEVGHIGPVGVFGEDDFTLLVLGVPLGMVLHPGIVPCGMVSHPVENDGHAVLVAHLDQVLEVVDGAEFGCNGLVVLDASNNTSLSNEAVESLKGVRIRSMAVDNEGNLVVATFGRGIVCVEKSGKVTNYVANTEEIGMKTRFVENLSDNTVVASDETGLLFIKDRKLSSRIGLDNDFTTAAILNIHEMPDGKILAGSDGDGIIILEEGKPSRYITKKDGLYSDVILRMVKDEKGDGIFVLTGSGVCYLKSDYTVEHLPGVPYFNNYDLWQLGDNIFFLSGAGIYVLEYNNCFNETGKELYHLLDVRSGLYGDITSNSWNCTDNGDLLYICTNSGLYQLNMKNYETLVKDFRAKITMVRFDGALSDVTDYTNITIPQGVDKVEILLELANFTSQIPGIRYRMRPAGKTGV